MSAQQPAAAGAQGYPSAVAAAPLPEIPEDPEDPQVILRDLPEQERAGWLAQSRDALEAARDPAGYSQLRLVLRIGRLRAIACNSPGFYERTDPDRVRKPGVPIEDVVPDWPERLAAAVAARE
jgi:Family of unknown function (DUF6247)